MRNQRSIILRAFFVFFVCILTALNLFSVIAANGAGNGYDEGGNGDEKANSLTSIETKIEISGSYFLAAYSDCLELSKLIELSNINGRDYDKWQQVLDNALSNIRNAKRSYYDLICIAKSTPYNWQIVYKLWFFNYYEFRIKYSLKKEVFGEVERYLSYGNITGIFEHIYNSIDTLEGLLIQTKNYLSSETMPEISIIWQVNEKGADILLFSQYTARVFYNI